MKILYTRSRIIVMGICMPSLPFGSENIGYMLLVPLALMVAAAGLHIARKLSRRARRGGWDFPSRWFEAKRLSKQQMRIQRQAIPSSRSPGLNRRAVDPRDERSST